MRDRPVRYQARHQARLDGETAANLNAWSVTFHRTCAAMLRFMMRWGLTQTQGWTVDTSTPSRGPTLSLVLEPDLLRRVQEAATAHRASVAAWVCEAVRRVTREDEATAHKLQQLVARFGTSRAAILRQLVAQATPEDFPQSWQLAAWQRRQKHS
jgi:hypothetical protein